MAFSGDLTRKTALAALIGGCVTLGGCGIGDVHVDAPILEAAGIQLNSKKVEEDAPEGPGLVIPPKTDQLPPPGTQTAAAQQAWPEDPDKIKKRKEEEEARAREEYCREGKWREKSDITEFEKDVGQQARCPSKLGETVSKSLGGRSSQ